MIMGKQLFFRYLCVFLLSISSFSIQANEITLSHNGITLNAALELVPGKTIADDIILITHGAMAHRDMEMLVYLRNLLHEQGFSTLAINLSLGLNNRRGMYDCKLVHGHHNVDAAKEISLWVEWLAKQGAKKISLLGHSRGGAQTALYAASYKRDVVKSVVLMAPATIDNTSASAYQSRFKQPIAPLIKKANLLVAAGKGSLVLDNANLLMCRDTPVMASTFLSYYGADAQVDGPAYLKDIPHPVLVVVGGKDRIVSGLEKKITPMLEGSEISMYVIPEAGHFFRDLNTDDAVDAIVEFIEGNK